MSNLPFKEFICNFKLRNQSNGKDALKNKNKSCVIEHGLDMSAQVWALEKLYCCVLLQGFALVLIILAKLFKASIKEVKEVSPIWGGPKEPEGCSGQSWKRHRLPGTGCCH